MSDLDSQPQLDSLLNSFRRGDATRPKTESELSLVIPTLGRAILGTCLAHLVAGSAWPARIIVVDQGQREKIAAWLHDLESIGLSSDYVPSSQTGRASGLNSGLERVKTTFVLITDDDCFPDRDWVRNMAIRLREHPGSIVSGHCISTGEKRNPIIAESLQEKIQYRPGLKFDSLTSGTMGAPMEIVNRVGKFDESDYVITAEDVDWAYRALKIGIPIVSAREIVVSHCDWRKEHDRKAQFASYARSHGGFYGKYLYRGDWIIPLRIVIHHFRAFRRCLLGTVKREEEDIWRGRAYLAGLMPGIIAGWKGAKRQD